MDTSNEESEAEPSDCPRPSIGSPSAAAQIDEIDNVSTPERTPSESGEKEMDSGPSEEQLAKVRLLLSDLLTTRISVVSKIGHRYEGELVEVDEDTRTLLLAGVRFWGTENRRNRNGVPARPESYGQVKFRLGELQAIFAHVEESIDLLNDPAVVQCGTALHPIMSSTVLDEALADGFTLSEEEKTDVVFGVHQDWDSVLVDTGAALKLLDSCIGSPCKVSIISKTLIRYEGFLKSLKPESTEVVLACVRLLGTEDRPAAKKVTALKGLHPTVTFQLSEARAIKVFYKMSDEMVEDGAIIPNESTVNGFVSAPQKHLTPSSPVNATENSTQFINGSIQPYTRESSPRKESGTVLQQLPTTGSPMRSPRRPAAATPTAPGTSHSISTSTSTSTSHGTSHSISTSEPTPETATAVLSGSSTKAGKVRVARPPTRVSARAVGKSVERLVKEPVVVASKKRSLEGTKHGRSPKVAKVPKVEVTSKRHGRDSDGPKCRKTFGVEKSELWCKNCKWKKPCTMAL